MKFQKSTVARGAIAVIAAGAALGLTACSSGQITQTDQQVAAVNGVQGQEGDLTIRDVQVVLDVDGEPSLKFTASNLENNDDTFKLQSVTVDGQSVNVDADKTIKAGCNLVIDAVPSVDKTEAGNDGADCVEVGTAPINGVKDLFVGGHKDVQITFDHADFNFDAPVVAYDPEAGDLHRDPSGVPSDK